jgi:transposase
MGSDTHRVSEMIRLPLEVTGVLRRRAQRRGITVAEAARRLILGEETAMDIPDEVAHLQERLAGQQDDLEEFFEEEGAKPRVVGKAIDALTALLDEWPQEEEDEEGEDDEDEEESDEE